MDGLSEIMSLAEGLRHPFPEGNTIRISKMQSSVWMGAIEMLEGRLLLANAMHGNQWWNQPTTRAHAVDNTREPIQINDIRQMTLLLDSYIVKRSSKETPLTLPFNLKNVLSRILLFKMSISSDKAFRLIYATAAKAIETGERQEFPRLSIFSGESYHSRIWYKYYGMYAGVLQLIRFSGEAISKMTFQLDWLDEEDGVLMMLICYALHSGRDEKTLKQLYKKAEKTAAALPSARLLLTAIKALHIRSTQSAQ